MLKAALHRVLTITQTSMGNVQLAESGRLHLARHTGLNKYFTDYFAFVDAPTTSCARAASTRQQVTVREVGTAAVVDESSRHAILQTGSRAAHSIPLTNGKGHVLTPPGRLHLGSARRAAADGNRRRPLAVMALAHRRPRRPGTPPHSSRLRLPLTRPTDAPGAHHGSHAPSSASDLPPVQSH
ncbi:hypothetical protein [Streptomyces rubrogriseus]|uniref:hypothetical protein n=1 Tax=Streptomyces rubrogriseus TaxID=194673 RepID=UPI0036879CAE